MTASGFIVAGASGLVGRALVAHLLARPDAQVHALLRDPTRLAPRSGLSSHRVDYARADLGLSGWPPLDAAFCALGTTLAQAGSQVAFEAVDHDAVLAFARAARAHGVQRLAVVSALGADARSRVFYNRVKGQTEDALIALGLPRLVVARPSLLAGERGALGQPTRWGEQLALALTKPLAWALPAGVRPIAAGAVARAMVTALLADGPAVQVLESAQLQRMGT